jgi:hypothetical protein
MFVVHQYSNKKKKRRMEKKHSIHPKDLRGFYFLELAN